MSKRMIDDIEKDIITKYGMLLNIRQCGEVLGYTKREATKRFLDGVPFCDMGKEKKYLARDIAKRIDARMSVS